MAFGGRSRAKLPIFTLPPEVTWDWQGVFCGHLRWNFAAIRGMLPAASGGAEWAVFTGYSSMLPVAGSSRPTFPTPGSVNQRAPSGPLTIPPRVGEPEPADGG